MRIYRIRPPERLSGDILGGPGCRIRALDCPVCGVWGNIALWYPTVECPAVAKWGEPIKRFVAQRGERPEPMTIEEYERLSALVEPLLGPDRPVEPGTSFGAMADGEVRGKLSELAWTWSADFRPFVWQSMFEEIQAAGFPVAGVPVEVKSRRKFQEPLIQLEVRPTAKLAGVVKFKKCEICGRIQVRRRKVVDRAAFDDSIPVQSIYEIPTYLVVSEDFAKFLRKKKYSDVELSVQKAE